MRTQFAMGVRPGADSPISALYVAAREAWIRAERGKRTPERAELIEAAQEAEKKLLREVDPDLYEDDER